MFNIRYLTIEEPILNLRARESPLTIETNDLLKYFVVALSQCPCTGIPFSNHSNTVLLIINISLLKNPYVTDFILAHIIQIPNITE